MGLMKLSTYYKQKGDRVRFFKGNLKSFILDVYSDRLIELFEEIDSKVNWNKHKKDIVTYLKRGYSAVYTDIVSLTEPFGPSVGQWLKYFRSKFRTGKHDEAVLFDEICVSTLFTFHYKITVETINFCKTLLSNEGRLFIGGVMASVIPSEIEKETKIKPIEGLLNRPGIIDKNDSTIIDELCPDYSILEEIDYNYPENDGYYAYMTRGCIRTCSFCAVPILEPEYQSFFPIQDKIDEIKERYGEKKNLLLFDNNVLASKDFPKIIDEIRKSGFYKGAKYREPNLLELAITNLKKSNNEFAYRKLAFKLIKKFSTKLSGKTKEQYFSQLDDCGISFEYLPSSIQLISFYQIIAKLYDERRNKAPKARYVDFNQGVDARLIDEYKMRLLSTIPVRPLRIAFDSMSQSGAYERAVRLAARYDIKNLSNYLLFNYKDKPVELYQRLKLNIDLCEEIESLRLYSFPMRYSPIWDDNGYHHNRKYVGKHWNRKFIRAIQCVLNATKGKVGYKKDFFEAAFGKSEEDFFQILWLPEEYILNREKSIESGLVDSWRKLFYSLSKDEYNEIKDDIENNELKTSHKQYSSRKLNLLKEHYQLTKDDIHSDEDIKICLLKNADLLFLELGDSFNREMISIPS